MGMFSSHNTDDDKTRETGFLGTPETLENLEPPLPFAARVDPLGEPYQRSSAYVTETTQYLSVNERKTGLVVYAAIVQQMQMIRRGIAEAAASDLYPGEFAAHINDLLDTYGRLHVTRSQMNESGITDRDVMGY